MQKKTVSVVALAVAACFAGRGYGADAEDSQAEKDKAKLHSFIVPAAIAATGIAALAVLAARRGGGNAAPKNGSGMHGLATASARH
jgi:hypothetical protein